MTQVRQDRHTALVAGDARPDARSRWPLWSSAAGLSGLVAAVLAGQPQEAAQRTAALAAVAAALLLVVASASWRRFVEPRVRSSTAAHVVPLALVVSAAGLATGHADDVAGWAGVMGAAAATAWMALRERSVSRAVGLASSVAALALPLEPALVGPAWLVVVGLGLAYGSSTIAR